MSDESRRRDMERRAHKIAVQAYSGALSGHDLERAIVDVVLRYAAHQEKAACPSNG